MNQGPGQLLVATDFSEAAGLALGRAAQLAREHGLPMHLVHALGDGDWLDRLARVSQGQFGEEVLRKSAGSRLARLREHCLSLDVAAVDYEVLQGPLHGALGELAQEHPDALLVMGARGSSSVREQLLGSTADRVLRAGVLPVLLVRREPAPWRRVLLATDFSTASARAAGLGAALAPAASHFLLHACEPVPDRELAAASADAASLEAFHQGLLDQARHQVEAFMAGLPTRPASLTRAVREGPPAAVLAAFVEEAQIDLVVLGSRPRARWEANLLGSTALFATNRLPCDVLLVPGVA